MKTDKRDACKLAHLHRAGDLVAVHIPDREDEVIRDVCRGRTDAVNEVKRTKQQLQGFMLRNGYRYKGTANWTAAHMRYLRELVVPHRAQKMVMEEYLLRIDTATAQVARIDDQMELLLETWSRRPFVEALMGFRGFQTAVDPDFRTTGLSGICVLKMVRKDAWKWEENEEHSRTSSRPRWRSKLSRA